MKAIVYVTNTGTTKKYAELLSEKTGIEAYDISAIADIPEDSQVIFLGWVMGGAVQGLEQIRAKFPVLYAVCPVGMMKSEKNNDEIKAKNNITEPMFFLQGDFHIDRLKGMYKMMMGMMMRMLKAKVKELEPEKGEKMLELFEKGLDGFNEDNLADILVWLENNQ